LSIIKLVEEANASKTKEWAMKRFYRDFWIPFTFNKRRLLVLAIASYLALC